MQLLSTKSGKLWVEEIHDGKSWNSAWTQWVWCLLDTHLEMQHVAGRPTAPKDVHILISRSCDLYATLGSKRDFADVIN